MTQHNLGDVSSHGQARRVSPEWGKTQDGMANMANNFLLLRVPSTQELVRVTERAGTVWLVKRGIVGADLILGDDFKRRFGERAEFKVTRDSDEYRLRLADPSEVWQVSRGKVFRVFYFSLVSAALGAMLMFRPEILFEALPRFE